ncbi:Lysophospholipase [Balamuthia mandrillaris]
MRFAWVLLLMVLCWFVAEGARQKEPLKSNFRVGEDIKRNEPQYTRRTAPAQNDREQAQNEQGGKMVDVSGYNFEAAVLNSNKDVFIEFYVAWCPHCRNIMPVLDEVAELYQGKKDFNDVAQRYGVSGFPTMILFRKGDTQGELYKGKRDVESFVTWLTARIGPPPDKLSIEQQGKGSTSVDEEEAKEKTKRDGTVKEEEVRKEAEQKAGEKTEEKEEDEAEEAVVKQNTKEERATWEDEGQGDDDQLLQKGNRAYSFKTKEEELKDRIKEVQMAVMEAARNMAAKANQQPLESPPQENNESSTTIQSSAPVNQAYQGSLPEALPTTMSEPSGLLEKQTSELVEEEEVLNSEEEAFFAGYAGVQLFYRSWTRQRAKGAIILVHDVGSHSGRYEDLYSALFFSGYSIYLYDLRGHGRSPGQRGHVEDWLHFRSDLHTFVELVHKQLNNKAKHNANKHHSKSELNAASASAVPLPLFLMGHGVGGTIVADYVLHSSTRVSGLALFSPCLHSPANSSVVQELATYTMSMLWPTYNWNWRTGAVAEELLVDEVDPLSHSLVSARLDAELREAEKAIHGRVSRLALPLFLTVAKEEAVEKREGIQHLYASVPNKEQTVVLRWYDGNGDYIFTETPSIFSSDLERWLQELSGSSS